MKILHILISFDEKDGGPPRGLATLAKAQANEDDVSILPSTGSEESMIIKPGVYGNLTVHSPLTQKKYFWPIKTFKNNLGKLIQESDIVHIHSNWRYHLIAAATLAIKYQKPYIIRPAGNLGTVPISSKGYFKKLYFTLFEKKYFNNASAVHCCTQKELKELEPLNIKALKFITAQPVDASLLELEKDNSQVYNACEGVTDQSKVILFLGRISWIKQLPMLLESFIEIYKKERNIHLILAGPWEDLSLTEKIKKQALEAGVISHVHFPGMIRGSIKASFLKRADIFVLPSKHENFGISVAEALSFGRPCIVNNGVALSSEISRYKAGLCFDTTQQLTDSIMKMILDNDFAKNCSVNALRLSENFKANTIAGKLKNYYTIFIKEEN